MDKVIVMSEDEMKIGKYMHDTICASIDNERNERND